MWSKNRWRLTAGAALIGITAMTLNACGGSSSSAGTSTSTVTNTYNTLQPGVMSVAIEPYMPYTGLQNGKLVGLDSDILNFIAAKLKLKVVPVVTDFTGMLGDVQSRRVDITIGGIAWSQARQQVGLFTDPPYYSPPAMAVHGDKTYPTVDDLKGLSLGTVTGYVWVKSIQAVPGAQLHAYPDANGVFNDLGAGRINVGFLDPLLIIYAQKQQPGLQIKTEYLQPPTDAQVAAHPDYTYFRPYQTGFYVPKQEPKLEQAVSQVIDQMYADGEMSKLIQKWGGDPSQFLKPSPWMAAGRHSADRPASWNPPSI